MSQKNIPKTKSNDFSGDGKQELDLTSKSCISFISLLFFRGVTLVVL